MDTASLTRLAAIIGSSIAASYVSWSGLDARLDAISNRITVYEYTIHETNQRLDAIERHRPMR